MMSTPMVTCAARPQTWTTQSDFTHAWTGRGPAAPLLVPSWGRRLLGCNPCRPVAVKAVARCRPGSPSNKQTPPSERLIQGWSNLQVS
jgi:hypothetical protein